MHRIWVAVQILTVPMAKFVKMVLVNLDAVPMLSVHRDMNAKMVASVLALCSVRRMPTAETGFAIVKAYVVVSHQSLAQPTYSVMFRTFAIPVVGRVNPGQISVNLVRATVSALPMPNVVNQMEVLWHLSRASRVQGFVLENARAPAIYWGPGILANRVQVVSNSVCPNPVPADLSWTVPTTPTAARRSSVTIDGVVSQGVRMTRSAPMVRSVRVFAACHRAIQVPVLVARG